MTDEGKHRSHEALRTECSPRLISESLVEPNALSKIRDTGCLNVADRKCEVEICFQPVMRFMLHHMEKRICHLMLCCT